MFILPENAQKIADELKATIGQDINVIDKDGVIIASTNPARTGHVHDGARRLIREHLPIVTIYDWDSVEGAQQGINLPITVGGETVGVIGITGVPEEVKSLGGVIKKMTELMVADLRKQEQETEIDRAKDIFYESWIFSDNSQLESLAARSSLLGIDMQRRRVALVIEFAAEREREALPELTVARIIDMLRRELCSDGNNFCFQSKQRCIAVFCTDSPSAASRYIAQLLKRICAYFRVSYSCGLSSLCTAASDMPSKYREAKLACSAAGKHGENQLMVYDDLSPEFILSFIPDDVKRRLSDKIFANCDESEKSELEETLKLYFKFDGNINRAAESIFVHRNTMYYRIRRVRELTGYDLQLPSDAFALYIVTNAQKR